MLTWQEHQDWEREWHDKCINSYEEERKQLVYAKKMGLKISWTHKTPYNIFLDNKSILDIGGGPYSLLLKGIGFSKATVADPCAYPDWVYARYDCAGIEYTQQTGEDLTLDFIYNEVWMYNVLQHTENPEEIIKNAKKYSKIIRFFDWIETAPMPGHPQTLKEEKLNKWFGGYGKVEFVEDGLNGFGYYGIFKGDNYKDE